MKKLFLWVIFSPALLFQKDIKHWYIRLLFVIFSPFMLYALISILFFVYVAYTPILDSFRTNHEFKNAEDIMAVTHSYIPQCDTVSAECFVVGVDYTEYEKFCMKNKLTEKEIADYSKLCKESDLWTETDSTFVYNDYNNIVAEKASHIHDFFYVTINKHNEELVVKYGDN